MRISKPFGKVLYWVCWSAVYLAFVFALLAMQPAATRSLVPSEIVGAIIVVIAAVTAGRIFRGRSEEVDDARPWWRMTAAAPASIVLACLSAVWALVGVFGLSDASSNPQNGNLLTGAVINIVAGGLLCLLFVISAGRVARAARVASLN